MAKKGYYLTAETKDRLDRLLNARPVESTPAARGPRPRPTVLVRCDSAAPQGGGGVGDECYPGTVLLGDSQLAAADQEEGDPVWLSMADGSAPTADQAYVCVLSGDVTADGETRPRAFGQPAGGSGPDAPLEGYVGDNTGGVTEYTGTSAPGGVTVGGYVEVPGDQDYFVTCAVKYSLATSSSGNLWLVEYDAAAGTPTYAIYGAIPVSSGADAGARSATFAHWVPAGSGTRRIALLYKAGAGTFTMDGVDSLVACPMTVL